MRASAPMVLTMHGESVLLKMPVTAPGSSITVHCHPGRVVVEERHHGVLRGAHLLTLAGGAVGLPPLSAPGTLRALTWKRVHDRGLGDRFDLVEALLPDSVGSAVAAGADEEVRENVIHAFSVAVECAKLHWDWPELPEDVQGGTQAAVRDLLLVAAWRAALRAMPLDRHLVRIIERPADALELETCSRIRHLLGLHLLEHDMVLPVPVDGELEQWRSSILYLFHATGTLDPEGLAATCAGMVGSLNRAIRGSVSESLDSEEPRKLRHLMGRALAQYEGPVRQMAARVATDVPGGWVGVAVLWLAHLTGLGLDGANEVQADGITAPEWTLF